MTSSPTGVAGLPGLTVEAAEFWAATERELAQMMPLPTRSTDAPLSEWVGPVAEANEKGRSAPNGDALVEAGVALGDVVTYSVLHPSSSAYVAARGSLAHVRLLDALTDLARDISVTLGVRDAIGWILVHGSLGVPDDWDSDGETGGGAARTVADRVQAWAAVGLGHDGWRYAAAGFTPTEAVGALAAGTVDPAQAQMMAALRGVALPIG